MIQIEPIIAGASGMAASVVASVPVDHSSLDAIGRWPLTVVLGAVCCFCVYLNYRQGVMFQAGAVRQAEQHRIAAEKLAKSNTDSVQQLIKSQSASVERLAASSTKMSELLMQRPCLRERNAG